MTFTRQFWIQLPLILAFNALFYGVARADDIVDAIAAGQKSYQAGDFAAAKQSLETASQLIAQKNAEGFAKVLPKPLSGWTAKEAESTASGLMALGGSVASLAQQIAIFSNAQMAGLMVKLVPINGQKAIQTKDGDITMMVGNRFVINVNGTGSSEDKLAYAKAVDVGTLTKMK